MLDLIEERKILKKWKKILEKKSFLKESFDLFGPTYSITYETITPESAEFDDVQDRGIEVDEEPLDLDDSFIANELQKNPYLDESDVEDQAAVLSAVNVIKDLQNNVGGTIEPSSPFFQEGTWYKVSAKFDGEKQTIYGVHFSGLNHLQQRDLYNKLLKQNNVLTKEGFRALVIDMIKEEYKRATKK